MIGFETVASPVGLIIGIVCGLIPLGVGLRYGHVKAGVWGFIACAVSGFACGFLGGLPMILMATAVVFSYAYVNKQDPFTSRQSLEEVNFEETTAEYVIRQFAAFGRTLRAMGIGLVRNKGGFIGFLGIMFFAIMSIFGPLVVEYEGSPRMDRRESPQSMTLFQLPSNEFPLGLDWQGRSILSHIVYGGQTLIVTSVQAGLMATLVAVLFGSLAALLGGFVDQILSAFSNFILTIPQFPLLLVLASILTFTSNFMLAVLLAALSWPTLMRAVRAQVLSLRERDYVEAAITLDLGLYHIIVREVFPNMVSYIAINFIFAIRAAMYALVGLVILGMVPLREPDWGIMIWNAQSRGAFYNPNAMMMAFAPIVAIALFQLSLILFTRSLEEIFNPRLRRGL
ncbi:MAG: ABC transporter permease [Anaerolineaceae bacterium]|nr:MAG: ABC transporter permease [Anaerolineaceae bacterium]